MNMKMNETFRIFNKKTKKYENNAIALGQDGALYFFRNGMVAGIGEDTSMRKDYIVERCSGVPDINGRLIYENDKVQVDDCEIITAKLGNYKYIEDFGDQALIVSWNFMIAYGREGDKVKNMQRNKLEIIGNANIKE